MNSQTHGSELSAACRWSPLHSCSATGLRPACFSQSDTLPYKGGDGRGSPLIAWNLYSVSKQEYRQPGARSCRPEADRSCHKGGWGTKRVPGPQLLFPGITVLHFRAWHSHAHWRLPFLGRERLWSQLPLSSRRTQRGRVGRSGPWCSEIPSGGYFICFSGCFSIPCVLI